jgi:hypothetical protein
VKISTGLFKISQKRGKMPVVNYPNSPLKTVLDSSEKSNKKIKINNIINIII